MRQQQAQNESNVNEKALEAAVQELFGNESGEQDFQPNMVLSSDLESNLKSSDLLNMDMILSEKPKKIKKSPAKPKILKGKALQLDELLKSHKERMKAENSSKIQIFKQKRKKRATALAEPEQCFQCGKVFHYKGYMEIHLRSHSNYKPLQCNVCSKRFTQVSNLNLHLRTHSKEKPFCCEKCPKMFATSSNLKAHLRTHSNLRPFSCHFCNRTFKSTSELKSHEGTHSHVKSKICKFCGKSFYKTSYLNVHVRNIHYGVKKYQCDSCNKSFSNSSNLAAHKRVHTGDKPYICKFEGCTSKFNQSSSLVRHMKSHNKPGKAIKIETKKKIVEEKIEEVPVVSEVQIPSETNQLNAKVQHSIPQIIQQPSITQYQQPQVYQQQPKQPITKKTPYIIPELISSDSTPKNLPSCQQIQPISHQSYIPQQPTSSSSLLPEALNPMNLINNSSTSNANYSNHSASSLLLPSLPSHHETQQIVTEMPAHHFPNHFESTNYLAPTPNILQNSFNFIMGGLDFSKNSLNGEPTYIDY